MGKISNKFFPLFTPRKFLMSDLKASITPHNDAKTPGIGRINTQFLLSNFGSNDYDY